VSARVAYLDPSALVLLVLGEPGGAELTASLRGTSARITSVVSRAEVQRAAALRDPAAAERAVEIMARLSFIELDSAIVAQAATLRPAALRTIDAIHVASALALAESLDAFVTYDPHRAAAARGVGLSVESPGVELDLALETETELESIPVGVPLDAAMMQRVVDRLVGRLRPSRVVLLPGPSADTGRGDPRLVVVLGDWSPGRDSPRQAQEAISDLGVSVDLGFVDDDDPGAARTGRVLYQVD